MTFTPCLSETDPNRQDKLQAFVDAHEFTCAMTGNAGVRLHYSVYDNPGKPLLMVAPGRMEAAFKYREVAMDFWHQGYQVVILDHRGQGLSQRFFNQPNVGHMDDYDKAADDLITLTQRCQRPGQPVFVLGHSMGGSIVLRALQLQPQLYQAAAVLAPMLSLNLGVPTWLAKLITGFRAWLDQLYWHRQKRVPGFVSKSRQEYRDSGFVGNHLTSSQVRYQAFRQLYREVPRLQLGGPSAGWIYQSLKMMQQIQNQYQKICRPLLMLTAGQEMVVTAKGQDQLRQKMQRAGQPIQWLLMDHSHHEILEESDPIRSAAISSILRHFTQTNDKR